MYNSLMSCFTNYQDPPEIEDSYLAREEEIEHWSESRLRKLEAEYDYPLAACGNCGRTDVPLGDSRDGTYKSCYQCREDEDTFAPKPVKRPEPQRGEQFSEVADAA